MTAIGSITIGVDPNIQLGPLDLTWHGVMIAVGVVVGAVAAGRYAGERRLARETVFNLALAIALAGIVGSRVLYLVVNEPGSLLRPSEWLGTRGFAFYGAIVFGVLAAAIYVRRARLDLRYLDALGAGFPIGLAVGRVGDVINGEHYGPATSVPWGVRYTHPDAEVPYSTLAYHSGGLYEVVLAAAIFALVWPLRNRFRRPTALLWSALALYAAGRFAMFYWRSDTSGFALGVNEAQAISIALAACCALGYLVARRRFEAPRPP